MVDEKAAARKSVITLLVAVLVTFVSGCSSRHNFSLSDNYTPGPHTRIELGTVTNETGTTFDIDIERMFADALTEALRKEKLLSAGSGDPGLVLTVRILEYEKGNAFHRWLLPGTGVTVLSVEGELGDGEQLAGSFQASRGIAVGGAFSVGAWKKVFVSIAKDVAKDLRSKLL